MQYINVYNTHNRAIQIRLPCFIQVFSSFTQPFPWFVAAEFRTFAPAVWAVTPGASPGAPREEESTWDETKGGWTKHGNFM